MKSKRQPRTMKRNSFGLVLLSILLVFSACRKTAFFAPDKAIIIISTNKTFLNPGEEAQINIMAFNADGEPLHNHTQIVFSVNMGSISPSEIEIFDGRASVNFLAGNRSGIAEIKARSGTVQADPNPLQITIGSAALKTLSISADPAYFSPGGGRSRIRVFAFDTSGNLLSQVPIVFLTDSGNFLNNQGIYLTDTQGMAQIILDTTATAKVKASSGDKSAEITIKVETETPNVPPTADFAISPTTPSKGDTIYFNGALSNDTDGYIVNWNWDFGDGQAGYGESLKHHYNWTGSEDRTFSVVLIVTDNRGGKSNKTTSLTVKAE